MERIWTVIEKVGQEYYYQVEAESKQEAIEKVRDELRRLVLQGDAINNEQD
ncbi:hypothetical protein ES703_112902 [subsurface metagenome]